MSDRRQIAVFGGSFDPPHVGHVLLATYALSEGVDQVIVAPTFAHAFGKVLSDFDHRLAMCELAFEPLRRVEVSPIERELGGESRTLRLVRELATRHPDARLRLLIGSDILHERARWKSFDEIVALAPLLVCGRSGHAPPADELADELADGPLMPEVSSTRIRTALARGESVAGWVPLAVRDYVAKQGLYPTSAP
jgi:nicotinate-nucleotide adenylyltransferase